MTRHVVSEANFNRALRQGRAQSEREFRASSVTYWPDQDAVAILTGRHGGFLVPRRLIDPLRDLDPAFLSQIELCPGGGAFEITELDIPVGVHGLLTAALPAMIPAEVLSSLLGEGRKLPRKPAPAPA